MARDGKKCRGNPDPTPNREGKLRTNGFDKCRERAVAAGKKGGAVLKNRKALRQQMLEIAVKQGLISKHFTDAIRDCDTEKIDFCLAAMKLVGLTYDQSEEAAKNINLKADTKSTGKVDHTLNITFSDAPSQES